MPHQRVAMLCPAVMHPFTIPARFDQPSAFKMPEMPRYSRLHHAQRVGQFTNARLAACEQVQQSQPRRIAECLEQHRRLGVFSSIHHHPRCHIWIAIYMSNGTNALAAFADGVRPVVQQIATADELHVPVVVLGEYRFGIATSRRRREYEVWLARGRAFWNVLPLIEETAVHYASIRQQLKRLDNPLPASRLVHDA